MIVPPNSVCKPFSIILLKFIFEILPRLPDFEVALAVTVLLRLLVISISDAFMSPLTAFAIEEVTLLVISRTEPEISP